MSGETAARSDKSEKKKNSNGNESSEHVPLAQHEILKAKYETLYREHETLIKTLELLEKTHGFTIEDLEKKQREEALMGEKDTEKWKNKFGEIEKKLEKLEKGIEDLMLLDETEVKGPNVNSNNVSDEGVILISDDEEGSQKESSGGHSKPSHQKPQFSFIL